MWGMRSLWFFALFWHFPTLTNRTVAVGGMVHLYRTSCVWRIGNTTGPDKSLPFFLALTGAHSFENPTHLICPDNTMNLP